MTVAGFLITVFTISLSGALSPGPVTTATIAMGKKSPFSGLLIAIGHGILEFPLMFGLLFGLGRLFELAAFTLITGIIGGVFLVYMGIGMLNNIPKISGQGDLVLSQKKNAVLTGFMLSATNPYFLIWFSI